MNDIKLVGLIAVASTPCAVTPPAQSWVLLVRSHLLHHDADSGPGPSTLTLDILLLTRTRRTRRRWCWTRSGTGRTAASRPPSRPPGCARPSSGPPSAASTTCTVSPEPMAKLLTSVLCCKPCVSRRAAILVLRWSPFHPHHVALATHQASTFVACFTSTSE